MIVLPETVTLVPKIRPLLLLSGFLGAGKTSFLRALLLAVREKNLRADVILNDYENALVDAETLRDTAASVEAIAASCACCDGLESLVDLATSAATSCNDLLLIEVNGTADPVPLLESFTLLESKLQRHPRWQVCVLDARNFGKRGAYSSLEAEQLETASHVFLNHAEDLSPADRERLFEVIRTINPTASETTPDSMADRLARAVSQDIHPLSRLRAPGFLDPPPKSFAPSAGRPQAHEFTGCQILLPTRVSWNTDVYAWLDALPPGVVRAKALLTTRDEPEIRRLFERVGTEVMPRPIRVEISNRVPSSAILIGPSVHPQELLEMTRRALGEECRFPC